MGEVTRIKQNFAAKRRSDIFIDGEYAFSVDNSRLKSLGLREGAEAESVLPEDAEKAEYESAMERCLFRLTASMRTQREMEEYLRKAGYCESLREGVISRLLELGYINDERFAESYADSKIKSKSASDVRRELVRKGVDREIARDAVEEDPEAELTKCVAIAQKYMKRAGDVRKNRASAQAALARRGYSWDTIKKALDKTANGDDDWDDCGC